MKIKCPYEYINPGGFPAQLFPDADIATLSLVDLEIGATKFSILAGSKALIAPDATLLAQYNATCVDSYSAVVIGATESAIKREETISILCDGVNAFLKIGKGALNASSSFAKGTPYDIAQKAIAISSVVNKYRPAGGYSFDYDTKGLVIKNELNALGIPAIITVGTAQPAATWMFAGSWGQNSATCLFVDSDSLGGLVTGLEFSASGLKFFCDQFFNDIVLPIAAQLGSPLACRVGVIGSPYQTGAVSDGSIALLKCASRTAKLNTFISRMQAIGLTSTFGVAGSLQPNDPRHAEVCIGSFAYLASKVTILSHTVVDLGPIESASIAALDEGEIYNRAKSRVCALKRFKITGQSLHSSCFLKTITDTMSDVPLELSTYMTANPFALVRFNLFDKPLLAPGARALESTNLYAAALDAGVDLYSQIFVPGVTFKTASNKANNDGTVDKAVTVLFPRASYSISGILTRAVATRTAWTLSAAGFLTGIDEGNAFSFDLNTTEGHDDALFALLNAVTVSFDTESNTMNLYFGFASLAALKASVSLGSLGAEGIYDLNPQTIYGDEYVTSTLRNADSEKFSRWVFGSINLQMKDAKNWFTGFVAMYSQYEEFTDTTPVV